MSPIRVLDQQTANSIAAGEVVERPASVVKELVENALDAHASVVSVEITQGGIRLIRVQDDGCGMDPQDALLAFGRHATSKIEKIEDLDSLATMGFRGEALASIAAVSSVRLETRPPGAEQGFFVSMEAGALLGSGVAGCPAGTSVSVENLFFNVPARFKFLRKDSSEATLITEMLERLALARPDVSFRLFSGRQEILHTPGNNDLLSAVYAVYGKQAAQGCQPIEGKMPPLSICGLIGRPENARGSRSQQSFFVNGRLVRSRVISAAHDDAAAPFLMKGKYLLAVLAIELPPQLVDVNVHPQKMEVRFWNDQEVYRLVYHATQDALQQSAGIVVQEMPAASEGSAAVTDRPQATGAITADSPQIAQAGALESRMAGPPGLPLREPYLVQPPLADDSEGRTAADNNASGTQTNGIGVLAQARYIGQLFGTYLLLESGQDLLLIDQHAAHEKILFESLCRRHQEAAGKGRAATQDLLVPLVLDFSGSDMQRLAEHRQELENIGFSYDLFGTSAVALRSVPDGGANQLLPDTAFRITLDALSREPIQSKDQISGLFAAMACHAAIKARDRLDEQSACELVANLIRLDNPYQCPHGRPVIIAWPQREIEKRFKRII